MADDAVFCPNCGARSSAGNKVGDMPSRQTDTAMLVWAIINIIFCSRIFGIIAIVYTLLAQDAATRTEELEKLRIAKIWNIVATSVLFISVIIILVFYGSLLAGLGSLLGGLISSLN